MTICLNKDTFELLLNKALQNCNQNRTDINKSINKDIIILPNSNPVPPEILSNKILGWWPVYYLYVLPVEGISLQIKFITYGQNYTLNMAGNDQNAIECIKFAQSKGGFLFGTYGYFGNTIDITLTATNTSSNIPEDVRIVYYDDGKFQQGTTITTNRLFNGTINYQCASGSGGGGCYITSATAGVALVDTTNS